MHPIRAGAETFVGRLPRDAERLADLLRGRSVVIARRHDRRPGQPISSLSEREGSRGHFEMATRRTLRA